MGGARPVRRPRMRAGAPVLCPSCGQTLLSRYNVDPLCDVCMRKVQAAPPPEWGPPTWLWDSGPWREALAGLALPAAVAVFRAASGLSQRELAELLGWAPSTLSLLESGQRKSLYDIRVWLRFADTLGIPRVALLPLLLGQADTVPPDDWAADAGPVSETLAGGALDDGALAGYEPPGDVPPPAGVVEDAGMDVDRRGFGGLAAVAVAGTVVPREPELAIPSRVSASHVRYLRSCLERVRDRDGSRGGGAIFHETLRHFSRARRMLDESDYTEAIGRKLIVVAAELGDWVGWSAYDSGNQQLARRMYGQAGLLAGSGDDGVVIASVYADMAQQSVHLARVTQRRGHAREALRFSERAADAVRHINSPKLNALIAGREARAHAELADEVMFRACIDRARRELDRGPRDADPVWAGFVTESEITGAEAMGQAALGEHARAAVLYRAVVDDPGRSPRDRAYYRARLARVLADDGDLAQAVTEGLVVLPDLGGQLTSIRVLNELRPIRIAAGKNGAEEFCALFDAAVQRLSA